MNHMNVLKIDLGMIPESNVKDALIHFAKKHNALVDDTDNIRFDISQVSGQTPEEKQRMHLVFYNIRLLTKLFHGQRLNITLLTLQLYIVAKILKIFGFNAEQLSSFIQVFRNL